RVTGVPQCVLRHFDVVERDGACGRDLDLLVTLAGDENDMTGLGLVNCQSDGFLASRIVGGQHSEVAAGAGSLAHQRTFAAVAVAAASEHRDNSSRPST